MQNGSTVPGQGGGQMAFFTKARASRAVLLACGMVWLGSADISVAGPAGIPYVLGM
jgi:hypothetical protein